MYNKLSSQSNKSKFGSQKNINYGAQLTPIMESGLKTAIPIWDLLKITEKEYDLAYKTPIIETKE
jgi:hypothetical protein